MSEDGSVSHNTRQFFVELVARPRSRDLLKRESWEGDTRDGPENRLMGFAFSEPRSCHREVKGGEWRRSNIDAKESDQASARRVLSCKHKMLIILFPSE